jgi:hypothetical protein
MIALSDAGLVYVAVAASRIPPNRRRRWLVAVARSLETGEPMKRWLHPQSAREECAPEARGEALLQVRVPETDIALALTALGVLGPAVADNRQALSQGVERALALLSDASQHDELILSRIKARLCVLQRK